MKARILRLASSLRESYWFVPTVMAFGAVLLAGAMIALDSYEGSDWMDRFAWLYASRPSGARQMLSAIGGSMITVAGTVFSVTIAAVVYASGQYGARLLSNFMSDRGNQVTLGTFIATFLYCLLVLRTIRSPEESGGVEFVPNIALLVGVLLALCSIGVLIFFIHHVPSKIHIDNVIAGIGDTLLSEIDQRFPAFIGAPAATAGVDEVQVPAPFRRGADRQDGDAVRRVGAQGTGYIQLADDAALLACASAHDLVLRLRYQPGDFVHAGRTLVEAWPAARCDDAAAGAIARAFAIGTRRTALQDLRFLFDELVEIAARSLSPGINDPFTAVACLDWIGAALSELAGRTLPSPLRADDDGALRVVAHPQSFACFLDRSLGTLAQYVAGDMVAALRYLRAIGEIARDCDDPERVAALGACAGRLEALSAEALHGFNLARVRERADALRRVLADPAYRRLLRDDTAWLGGTE